MFCGQMIHVSAVHAPDGVTLLYANSRHEPSSLRLKTSASALTSAGG